MEYILFVDYANDAERKRIDYTIERWKDRAEIEKPRGAVFRYSGDNADEFLDDLYSRLSAGKDGVKVFAGKRYTSNIPEKVKTLRYTTSLKIPTIQKFIDYLMKKFGTPMGETKDEFTAYKISTKKGNAVIEIAINPVEYMRLTELSPAEFINERNNIVVTVRGYGDVASYIAEGLDAEIMMFLKA
jgi:hypothetical protein